MKATTKYHFGIYSVTFLLLACIYQSIRKNYSGADINVGATIHVHHVLDVEEVMHDESEVEVEAKAEAEAELSGTAGEVGSNTATTGQHAATIQGAWDNDAQLARSSSRVMHNESEAELSGTVGEVGSNAATTGSSCCCTKRSGHTNPFANPAVSMEIKVSEPLVCTESSSPKYEESSEALKKQRCEAENNAKNYQAWQATQTYQTTRNPDLAGYLHVFNANRGTTKAKCGQSAECDCCKMKKAPYAGTLYEFDEWEDGERKKWYTKFWYCGQAAGWLGKCPVFQTAPEDKDELKGKVTTAGNGNCVCNSLKTAKACESDDENPACSLCYFP